MKKDNKRYIIVAFLALSALGLFLMPHNTKASNNCPANNYYATSVVQHTGIGYDPSTSNSPNANAVLGAPDYNPVNFDGSPGFVIVGFDQQTVINDGLGADIRLWLIDFSTVTTIGCVPEDETFTLLASTDGVNFVALGSKSPTSSVINQKVSFDFDIAGRLSGPVRFIKIQNARIITTHVYEGPDIDAIEILNCQNMVNPTPACSSDSQCGVNGFTGGPFCQLGGIYQNYRSYTCLNPGTQYASCTHTDTAKQKQACFGNQTCSMNGSNASCTSNASNLQVECNVTPNPATSNDQVTFGAVVTGGAAPYSYVWTGNCNSYTQNCTRSFGTQGNYSTTVQVTSTDGQVVNKICSVQVGQQCVANATKRCAANNSVYWYDSCGNQGTFVQQCENNQSCSNGTCVDNQTALSASCTASPASVNTNQTITFTANAQGGTGNYTFMWSGACVGSAQSCTTSFNNPGTQTASLTVSSGGISTTTACSVGVNQAQTQCTQNSSKQCFGNNVYWYDSCGVRGSLFQACSNGCQNGVCANSGTQCDQNDNKQCVGNSVYWFDSCGNRGSLFQNCGSNRICQNGQCINNYYPPYEPPYHPPYYPPYQPTYQPPYQPFQPQVLGATTVSTGLTNNLFMDSFFLPLMLALLGIWMIKSGYFSFVEKWMRDRKRAAVSYSSNNELETRILSIRREEID